MNLSGSVKQTKQQLITDQIKGEKSLLFILGSEKVFESGYPDSAHFSLCQFY